MTTRVPIHLDFNDLPVLVVGAGPVGTRRRDALVAAGALVTWVAPNAPSSLGFAEPFTSRHLAGQRLVFACATPEVNQAVVRAARKRGVLVSRADAGRADFQVPAAVHSGPCTASLTTGVPAATRVLARQLADELDGPWGLFVTWLGEVRAARPEGPDRQALLRRLANGPLLGMLCAGDVDDARAWLEQTLND